MCVVDVELFQAVDGDNVRAGENSRIIMSHSISLTVCSIVINLCIRHNSHVLPPQL